MPVSRRLLVSAACMIAGAMCLLAPTPSKGAEFEWRFQNNWVEARWESKMLKAFANRVLERSGGRLKITVYDGGSLGIKQSDHLQVLKTGAVHMAVLYPGYLARDVPKVADALPNGVIFTDEEAVKLNPVLDDIYEKGYSRWKATVVGWLNTPPYRLSIFCKEPIRTLEGLKGKKLRVWVKDVIDPFNALGIPAQLMPQEEMYVALQTGVVDCAIYSIGIASTISLQEVTRYAAPMFTLSGLSAIAVSNRHWAKLPKDLQQVVLEAGNWIYKETNVSGVATARKLEMDAVAAFAKSGQLTVLEPFSDEDKATFYNEVVKQWIKRTESAGAEEVANRKKIMSALAELRRKNN